MFRGGRAGALALAAILLLVPSCTQALTELVVVVDLDPSLVPGRDLVSIAIAIDVADRSVVRVTTPLTGPSAETPPLTLGMRSESGRANDVHVVATAFTEGGVVLVSQQVFTRFLPGQRRLVHIVLERACLPVTCADPTATCRGGACVDAQISPEALPPFVGTLPDAGLFAMDAGSDAGRDAGAPVDASDGGASDASDARVDAPSDAGMPDAATCEGDAMVVGEPAGCMLHHPPARPTCGDGASDGTTRAFALLDPVFDQSGGRWAALSYDLDGLCTNPLVSGTPVECDAPIGDPVLDGTGGEDNALGQVAYVSLLTFVPEYATEARASARAGRAAPVLLLTGWSGEDDDGRVAVTFATTVDVLPAGTSIPPEGLIVGNDLPDPVWDGTDTAYVGGNYFVGGDAAFPLITDDNAYVADRTIVMVLPPRAPIDIPTRASQPGVARIRLTEAHLVAHLSADGTSIDSAAIIGRWAYVDVLTYLDAVGACPGIPVIDMFRAAFDLLIRRSLDVRSVAGTGGPGVLCDSISTALPFQSGAPVIWGGPVPLDLVPASCP